MLQQSLIFDADERRTVQISRPNTWLCPAYVAGRLASCWFLGLSLHVDAHTTVLPLQLLARLLPNGRNAAVSKACVWRLLRQSRRVLGAAFLL